MEHELVAVEAEDEQRGLLGRLRIRTGLAAVLDVVAPVDVAPMPYPIPVSTRAWNVLPTSSARHICATDAGLSDDVAEENGPRL